MLSFFLSLSQVVSRCDRFSRWLPPEPSKKNKTNRRIFAICEGTEAVSQKVFILYLFSDCSPVSAQSNLVVLISMNNPTMPFTHSPSLFADMWESCLWDSTVEQQWSLFGSLSFLDSHFVSASLDPSVLSSLSHLSVGVSVSTSLSLSLLAEPNLQQQQHWNNIGKSLEKRKIQTELCFFFFLPCSNFLYLLPSLKGSVVIKVIHSCTREIYIPPSVADFVCLFILLHSCLHILPVSGMWRQTVDLLYLVCTLCTKGIIHTYEN